VEAREKALIEAIEAATRDREAAARLLEEHREQIEAARSRGAAHHRRRPRDRRQGSRPDGRGHAPAAAGDAGARAAGDPAGEGIRDRRDAFEAVDLAIAAAEKVIEKNLDNQSNRQIVDKFLASVAASGPALALATGAAAGCADAPDHDRRNYAEALLALARKANDLDGWGRMIDDIAAVLQRDPTFRNFMASPRVSARQKIDVLAKALSDRVPQLFLRFLHALVRNRRQMLHRGHRRRVPRSGGRGHGSRARARDGRARDR
jgi:hypothetical protein